MRPLLIALAVALSCAPVPGHAQGPGSPQALEAAGRLVATLSGDMIGQMSRAMTAQVWPKIESDVGAKASPAAMAELRREFETALDRFLVESMKDAPALYAKHFSAQELNDITAFYRTPTGAKSLQLMPAVTAEMFGTLMPRAERFGREIEATTARVLQKHGVRR